MAVLLKQSIHLNSDAELQIDPKFTSMLLFISITFTLSRTISPKKILSSDVTEHD